MKHYFRRTLTATAIFAGMSFAGYALANDSFVEEAKQQVAAATAKQEKWDGPLQGRPCNKIKPLSLSLPL